MGIQMGFQAPVQRKLSRLQEVRRSHAKQRSDFEARAYAAGHDDGRAIRVANRTTQPFRALSQGLGRRTSKRAPRQPETAKTAIVSESQAGNEKFSSAKIVI
jgi:hypothetical protein